MKAKFDLWDRIEVKSNGLKARVVTINHRRVQGFITFTEYGVIWDSGGGGQICSYMAHDVDPIWEKLDSIKASQMEDEGNPGKGYTNQDGLPRGLYGFDPAYPPYPPLKKECDHKWVDIGFTHSKIVCKHCDMEQK